MTITFTRNDKGLYAVSNIEFIATEFEKLNNGKDPSDEGYVQGKSPYSKAKPAPILLRMSTRHTQSPSMRMV